MFIVLRKIAYGPFTSAEEAFAWAERKWPGEDHDVQAFRPGTDGPTHWAIWNEPAKVA